MTMSVLVRRIKFGASCFRNKSRLISLASCLRNKQLDFDDDINKNKTIDRNDLSLPNHIIQKYLNHLATAYTSKRDCDDDISSLLKIREVIDLLENRSQVDEDMKILKELGDHDEGMKKLGHDEYMTYQNHMIELDHELINLILDNTGKDDCRDIIFEISAGVGGQEAMLFTADLLNMYQKHFEYLGFTHHPVELQSESGIGGLRHASLLVSGLRAYELVRHEGGVHRVQRIPTTERTGRMHTSTATVAVLPQPTDVEVHLHDRDLKIETKRASGAGGQSVNTTDSAVRITHLPTGIVVDAQSERSQLQNKKIALVKLRAKIYDTQINEQKSGQGLSRKKQRGMSQRNEKIRTYNYSQDRVTDHRLTKGTLRNLKVFMEGGESLEDFQERLQRDFQLKLLREVIDKYK